MSLSFNIDGLLPPGDHPATIEELRDSILVTGPGTSSPHWDRAWRGKLVDNLGLLARRLWKCGITEIFIGGSFAEDVDRPNDIDGYFTCNVMDFATGRLSERLNHGLDFPVWKWDDRYCRRDKRGRKKIPLWHAYAVELWPAPPGQFSGIPDRHGNILPWDRALRHSNSPGRRWKPRGVVKIEPES